MDFQQVLDSFPLENWIKGDRDREEIREKVFFRLFVVVPLLWRWEEGGWNQPNANTVMKHNKKT